MIEFLQVVMLVFSTPNPDVSCYIRDVTTSECIVWYNRSNGKFYDRFGNVIPNPLP